MQNELYELIEHTGEAIRHLISAEIALADGQISETQKATKQAQQLLSAMKGDVFEEVVEEMKVEGVVQDYDYPNNLELAKQLSIAVGAAGGLLAAQEEDNKVQSLLKQKLANSLATAIEIFVALYEN